MNHAQYQTLRAQVRKLGAHAPLTADQWAQARELGLWSGDKVEPSFPSMALQERWVAWLIVNAPSCNRDMRTLHPFQRIGRAQWNRVARMYAPNMAII
jgi:hypothetical protein